VLFSKTVGATECDSCPTGSYLVKEAPPARACVAQSRSHAALQLCVWPHAEPWSEADCRPCPDSTVCLRSIPPAAQKDVYLLPTAGALTAYTCPSGTCLSGEDCAAALGGTANTSATYLTCCAADRLPAVGADGSINLLCARCAVGLRYVSRGHALLRAVRC
jgi:hypothetical protein